MSGKTNLQFKVPSDLFNNGKELLNENRNKTSNSRDSKAFYGRRIFALGVKKLQELQEEKKEKAVDFKEIDQKTKHLVEKEELSNFA